MKKVNPRRMLRVGSMKHWIDHASFHELLRRLRFVPPGSVWFQGEVGEHFWKVYNERRAKLSDAAFTRASEEVGWPNPAGVPSAGPMPDELEGDDDEREAG